MYWSQLVQTCFFGSYFFGFVQHDTVWVCLSPALAILSCSRDGTSSVIITELHHGLKHLSRQLRWASLVTAWVVCSNNLLKNRCRSDKNSTATDKYCISSSFGFEIQLYHPQTLNFAASEFPVHFSLLWKFRTLTHFSHGNEAFNYPLLGCNGCCLAKAANECTEMGNCQFYTERRGVSVQVTWCLLTWFFWW